MDAKKQALRKKFDELDANGDGSLDIDELRDLLQKGNPGFKTKEVEQLYRNCDSNHDGRIDFDEFLNYIYGQDHSHNRTSGGRHDRMAKASAVGDDGTEGDWGPCEAVFTAFAGQDMDGKEFAKFCKDNKLIGHGMQKTDVDLIFAKVVPKGKRRMDFGMFQNACRHIANKRNQSNGDIQNIVSSSKGPNIAGTKTDAVRFYDDKSTFTGAHAHNANFEGTNAEAHVGRHDRNLAAAEAAREELEAQEDPALWPACQAVFEAFAGEEVDGREFLKLCVDIGLIGKGFTKQDVDIVFAGAGHGAKKIGFAGFQDCIKRIAQKKGKPVYVIQQQVSEASGPTLTGVTKTEAVKFYDDKSQFTGAAADVFGRDGHGDDRHAKMQAAEEAKLAASEDEHPWEECLATYHAFGGNDMDSREFLKLAVDCNLFDKKFTKNDIDIVFTKVTHGGRRLSEDQFCEAIRLVAVKKGVPTHAVQAKVASSSGPQLKGTKTEYSRFHDDKESYTGMHVGK